MVVDIMNMSSGALIMMHNKSESFKLTLIQHKHTADLLLTSRCWFSPPTRAPPDAF